MKNSLLLISLIFLSIGTYATKLGPDIGIGFKAGLNVNKLVGVGIKNNYATDPHAGLFLFINKNRLGVQIETVWTQNNITTDSSFYGLYHQFYDQAKDSLKAGSFRFSVISIPLFLNLKLTSKFWLQFGPQFDATVGMTDKNHILKSGQQILAANHYNFVGGFWYQFGELTSSIKLNAGARFLSGLSDMNNLAFNSDWKNKVIQLHVGINF